MFEKLKKHGKKLLTTAGVGAMMAAASLATFAADSTATNPYDSISNTIQTNATQLFTSAQTMVLAVIGAGLVIFGIFLMFKLGKRGINAATSSKG